MQKLQTHFGVALWECYALLLALGITIDIESMIRTGSYCELDLFAQLVLVFFFNFDLSTIFLLEYTSRTTSTTRPTSTHIFKWHILRVYIVERQISSNLSLYTYLDYIVHRCTIASVVLLHFGAGKRRPDKNH